MSLLDMLLDDEDVLDVECSPSEGIVSGSEVCVSKIDMLPSLSETSEEEMDRQWLQIKQVFASAKTPEQVFALATTMPFGEWLDYMIKMMPKEHKVSQTIKQAVVLLPARDGILSPEIS